MTTLVRERLSGAGSFPADLENSSLVKGTQRMCGQRQRHTACSRFRSTESCQGHEHAFGTADSEVIDSDAFASPLTQ